MAKAIILMFCLAISISLHGQNIYFNKKKLRVFDTLKLKVNSIDTSIIKTLVFEAENIEIERLENNYSKKNFLFSKEGIFNVRVQFIDINNKVIKQKVESIEIIGKNESPLQKHLGTLIGLTLGAFIGFFSSFIRDVYLEKKKQKEAYNLTLIIFVQQLDNFKDKISENNLINIDWFLEIDLQKHHAFVYSSELLKDFVKTKEIVKSFNEAQITKKDETLNFIDEMYRKYEKTVDKTG